MRAMPIICTRAASGSLINSDATPRIGSGSGRGGNLPPNFPPFRFGHHRPLPLRRQCCSTPATTPTRPHAGCSPPGRPTRCRRTAPSCAPSCSNASRSRITPSAIPRRSRSCEPPPATARPAPSRPGSATRPRTGRSGCAAPRGRRNSLGEDRRQPRRAARDRRVRTVVSCERTPRPPLPRHRPGRAAHRAPHARHR